MPLDTKHGCLKRHLSCVLLRHVFTKALRRRALCMEAVSIHLFPSFVVCVQPVNKIDLSNLYASTKFLSLFLSKKPPGMEVRSCIQNKRSLSAVLVAAHGMPVTESRLYICTYSLHCNLYGHILKINNFFTSETW
jgi:hypothetical protein